MLGGYKAGAKAYRTEKDADGNFITKSFDIYSPKMIANINGVEDVLESRCIPYVMQRTLNKSISESILDERDPLWSTLRSKLYVFALENWKAVRNKMKGFFRIN